MFCAPLAPKSLHALKRPVEANYVMPQLRLFRDGSADQAPAVEVKTPEAESLHTVKDVILYFLAKGPRSRVACAQKERERLLLLFCDQDKGAMGRKLLVACKPYHLEFWIDSVPSWAALWTKDRVNKTVQRAFNWARKRGLIERNPFQGVTYPRGREGRDITKVEFWKVFKLASNRFRLVLIWLRASGMRPCELRRLQWEHVRLELDAILQAEHKTAHSTGEPRRIIINNTMLKMLAYLLRRSKTKKGTVFLNFYGLGWSSRALTKEMARLRRKAGLPDDCKLYGCRHAFGTHGILNGVDVMTLAKLMGHKNISTTQRYVHLAGQRDHLKRAGNAASRWG